MRVKCRLEGFRVPSIRLRKYELQINIFLLEALECNFLNEITNLNTPLIA